jgi:hypothetical protein
MALSKSTLENRFEFVVHVQHEYDYRFKCDVREELFDCLKQIFFLKTGKNLPVYCIPEKLKSYETGKSATGSGLQNLPDRKYLSEEENLYHEHGESGN